MPGRRASWAAIVATGSAAGILSCAMAIGLDPIQYRSAPEASTDADSGQVPAGDGSTSDGGCDDAGGMIEPLDGNLVNNGDFEHGSGACAFWQAEDSILYSSSCPAVHSGARSCLVCPAGNSSYSGVFQIVSMPFDAGTAFTFSGYVSAPEDGGTRGHIQMALYMNSADGGQTAASTTETPPVGTWLKLGTGSPLSGTLTSVELHFDNYAQGVPSGCFLLDDALLVAE